MLYKKLYAKEYTSKVSTRVSNALLVGECSFKTRTTILAFSTRIDNHGLHTGEVIGQVLVGLVCDRVGRKAALVMTTLLIVIGAILATAAHGAHGSVNGLLWFITVARGITGVVSFQYLLGDRFPVLSHVQRLVGRGWGVPSQLDKCQRSSQREDACQSRPRCAHIAAIFNQFLVLDVSLTSLHHGYQLRAQRRQPPSWTSVYSC